MRILFMGTPDFSVPTLERILADGHEVTAVFTQPDRPKGRGYHLAPSPVKEAAMRHGIPVHQPLTLKDEAVQALIRGENPDCIVVVAYGRILPLAVLEMPRLGCINVHASLLPRYRGAAPIQWSVINGETVTGVTTMYMAKGIDTGDMILTEKTEIGENETSGELYSRLSEMGAALLSKTLPLLEAGQAPRQVQDDAAFTYAKPIAREDAKIDWSLPAQTVHNLVRGMNPQPSAFTVFDGVPFKVHETKLTQEHGDGAPGTITGAGRDGIHVVCGGGEVLLLTKVQAQGGKRMNASDFVLGHGIKAGMAFGA